jgi:D-alanyl-D-alanine carboxypeptidase
LNAHAQSVVRCPKSPVGQIKKAPILLDLLPEDINLGKYIAPNLVLVSKDYTIEKAYRCLTKETYKAFLSLNKAMQGDIGKGVFIRSAWRSFQTQQRTIEASPELAAIPGRSEHQLGTAIDFSHTSTQEREELFVNTPQYEWMKVHAYEYGFVQTYGENSILAGIIEPWHFRFVGVDAAKEIFETNDDPVGYVHRLVELRR